MILFINSLERLALWVSRFISSLAGVVLFFIVAVTCVDVIGRYFFNAPLYSGSELVQVSMAGVIFLSLPVMFFRHEHIIVDLFSIFQRGYLGWVLSIIFLTISVFVNLLQSILNFAFEYIFERFFINNSISLSLELIAKGLFLLFLILFSKISKSQFSQKDK